MLNYPSCWTTLKTQDLGSLQPGRPRRPHGGGCGGKESLLKLEDFELYTICFSQ